MRRESAKTSSVQGLRLFQADACLLTQVGDHLAKSSPTALASTSVLLPTMRLRVQLLAQIMHKRREAYIPPSIVTLGPFVTAELQKLPNNVENAPRPADAFELNLLGSQILSASSWRHLRPSHLRELLLLYKEACELSLVNDYPRRVDELIAEESTHAEAALLGFKERLEEAGLFFSRLEVALKEQSLISPQDLAKAEAEALLNHIQLGSWKPDGPILIAGVTSLAPYHVSLVRTLMQQRFAEIWLSEPPPGTLAARSPLAVLIEQLRGPVQKELFAKDTLKTEAATPTVIALPKSGGIMHCASIDEEITAALNLVDQALKANIPAQAIGIVVNGERSYTLPLLQRTQSQSTLFNFALPLSFRLTPIGSWIASLVMFLGNEDNAASLLDLLCHPLSLHSIHKKCESLLQDCDESGLANQICQDIGRLTFLGRLDELAKHTERPVLSAAVSWVLDLKKHLLGSTDSGKKISLGQWCAHLKTIAKALPTPETNRLKATVQPTLAYSEPALLFFEQFVDNVESSQIGTATFIAVDGFTTFLREHLLDEPIHRIGEPLAGVQVIQFSESRYVPFTVSILLGCHEGDLPSRLPQDEVIDHFTKPSLGFRPQQYLEALQDLNVALQFSRIPAVYLLSNQGSTQSPNIPSRYVQMLGSHGFRHLQRPVAPVFAERAKPPKVSSSPAEEDRNWFLPPDAISISALRNFVNCPFHFKAKTLKLTALQLPSSRLTPLAEGNMLHAVLEAFFSGKCTRLPHLRQKKFPQAPKEWPSEAAAFQESVTTRLMLISEQILPNSAAGRSLLLQLKLRSWPAFARFLWEAPFYQQGSTNTLCETMHRQEWNFNSEWTVTSPQGEDHKLFLRGSVDLIFRNKDTLIILDYKRRQVPTQLDVTLGIDPQLTAYQIGAKQLGEFSQSVAGYWNIMEGKWLPRLRTSTDESNHPLTLHLKKSVALTHDASKSLHELIHMRQKAMQQSAGADQNPFYGDASQCGRCDLAGVCRKNDPRFSGLFQQNKHLISWKIDALKKLKKVKI